MKERDATIKGPEALEQVLPPLLDIARGEVLNGDRMKTMYVRLTSVEMRLRC